MAAQQTLQTRIAVIDEKIDTISKNIDNITSKLEKDYVTNDRFVPVRNLVYGMVFLILTAVIGAILNFVLIMPHK